jgi:hypothetical protein
MIQAKPFRNELVPTEAELARREGCDYESASVLLERVRAEQIARGKMPMAHRQVRTQNEHKKRRNGRFE